MSYNQYPPGGQPPWSPVSSPPPENQPAYLNPLYTPQHSGTHTKTSPINQVKKTLSILSGRPTATPTSSSGSHGHVFHHQPTPPPPPSVYTQQQSPVPAVYSPGPPQGVWQPPQQQLPQIQTGVPLGGPFYGGHVQQPQIPQQQHVQPPPPGQIPPQGPPPVNNPHHQQHQQHQQYIPPNGGINAQGPPPAYQPPPPGSQFSQGGAAGVGQGKPTQSQNSSPYSTPSVTGGGPFTPPPGGQPHQPQQHQPQPPQQHQSPQQHQPPQQLQQSTVLQGPPAGPFEWGSLVNMSSDPPEPSEKFKNLIEGIAEYILDEPTTETSPQVVLPPSTLAFYYSHIQSYNSNYHQFFQDSLTKPHRLTHFYSTLSLEYLLIPQPNPSNLPSPPPPIPGLTLTGFERLSLLQLLLFPDLTSQLYTSLLTSPKRPIKDPSTGHAFPRLPIPRTSLPSQPHPALFSRFGAMWQSTINTPSTAPDADSEASVLNRRIKELQRDLDFHISSSKSAVKESQAQKQRLTELTVTLSTTQQTLKSRDEELAVLRSQLTEAQQKLTHFQSERGGWETERNTLHATLTSRDSELASLRSTLSSRETELTTLQQTITARETELTSLHHARTIRETELTVANTKLRDLQTSTTKLTTRLTDMEEELRTVRAERTRLVQELAEMKKVLAKKESEVHQARARLALPGMLGGGGGGEGETGILGLGLGGGNGEEGKEGKGGSTGSGYARREYAKPTVVERKGTGLSEAGRGKTVLPYPEH